MSATQDTTRESLVTASKEEVINALPDEEAAIDDEDVVLEFTGQAWIDEHARNVDGKETTYSVPLSALYHNGEWALDETPFRHFVSDSLHTHESAPEWVQEWDGPFELQVKHLKR